MDGWVDVVDGDDDFRSRPLVSEVLFFRSVRRIFVEFLFLRLLRLVCYFVVFFDGFQFPFNLFKSYFLELLHSVVSKGSLDGWSLVGCTY